MLGIWLISINLGDNTGQLSERPSPDSPATDDDAQKRQQPAPREQPEEDLPGIGEEARDGSFAFVVNSVDIGKTSLGDEFWNQTAQGEYVIVYLSVTNIGNEPMTFWDTDQYLYDTDERLFNADSYAALAVTPDAHWFEEVNPGNQVELPVVFDIPHGTEVWKLELHDSSFSSGTEIDISQ